MSGEWLIVSALGRAGQRNEHQTVDRLLSELRERLTAEDVAPAALSADVDRLIAELEAHLDYEEEQLVPILNAMTS